MMNPGLKSAIDRQLSKYLSSKDRYSKKIFDAMRYSVLGGGKRIRPIIVIESCLACGGNAKEAMPAGCAVELVHAYSLIHDDLPSMDDDDYRRGKPTCHKVFGEAQAILAGDALLPLAFNIISRELKPARAAKAVKELSDAIGARGMVLGQALDLEYKDKKKDKDIIEYINRMKTAKLFEASAKLGAIAAGRGQKTVDAMGRFGLFLGHSYQIVDDIIDKSDYTDIFGFERARKDSQDLIKKAKDSLNILGKRADRLKVLADLVLKRKT